MAASSRPHPGITLLKLFGILLAVAVLCAGVLLPYVGGLGLLAGKQANKFLNTACDVTESPPPQRTTMYASDGKTVIATIFTQDRQPVPLSQVPKSLQDALIATEDRRFRSHHGVDLRGLIRGAFTTSNGDTQGGSTLTMQYVKQERYYQAGDDAKKQAAAIAQTLTRKMQDAQCALDIEKRESKDKILENYLNIAFFGEGAYGIQTAAQTYFGVDVSKLTVPQSAMLVGMLQGPSEYDPFRNNGANLKASIDRRNEVIQNMVDTHALSPAQGAAYAKAGPGLTTQRSTGPAEGCPATATSTMKVALAQPIPNDGFFCEYAENWLHDVGGLSESQIQEGGLKIITTLDPAHQRNAQQNIQAVAANSKSTAILPEVDPKTGAILAMASSKLYGLTKDGAHTTIPIFTSDITGGASTFKLFPMLAALQAGADPNALTLSSNGEDAGGEYYKPLECGDPSYVSHNASPVGFTRNETLTSAMQRSSNVYFMALEDQLFGYCDLSPMVNLALQLGMNSLNDRTGPNGATQAKTIIDGPLPTFAIGQTNTNPLELAGAYGAVANDGMFCPPVPIKSVLDAAGQPVPVKTPGCKQVLDPQVARKAALVLASVTQPGGDASAQFQGSWYGLNPSLIGGKTGTQAASDSHGVQITTANSAIWFAGITPSVSATMAIFNINSPTSALAGLPGMRDTDAAQQMGTFAAQLWINSVRPSVLNTQWQWPPADAIDGGVPVATAGVINQPVDVATASLKAQGFKVADYSTLGGKPAPGAAGYCGSNTVTYPNVAYVSPTVAPPGSTIYICQAKTTKLQTYTPPPPPPKPKPTPTPGTSAGATPPAGGAATPPGRRTPVVPPGRR